MITATHREHGFTLLELLFAVGIFGIAATMTTQSLVQMHRQNGESEVRTAAIGAAQRVLDEIRFTDPSTLPMSGTSTQNVTVDSRVFAVSTEYCALGSFCSSSNIRQVRVGVTYRGQSRYQVDTVFCQLR
jgi:prepilin-type N-terminal cleavage/methylation domain-containing protein